MKLPNILTLSRIPILFVVVILLNLQLPGARTAALVLFIIGAITDWADGYYARKLGIVSNFGKLMDALTDKILMVGLFVTLVAMDILPGVWSLFLVLMILSREFLITGLRLVAASSGIVLAAEKSGKHKTVSQMIAAILLLLAVAIREDFPNQFSEFLENSLYWGGVGFFVLATVLTVSSGILYMIKYWSLFKGEEGEGNV
ncbi:MAG: CDP-diacylglycerol--glycerol-3-phosphate 3-phosphatidyltransferase [Lentimonas sp.]